MGLNVFASHRHATPNLALNRTGRYAASTRRTSARLAG
jgi:hypothetical protein